MCVLTMVFYYLINKNGATTEATLKLVMLEGLLRWLLETALPGVFDGGPQPQCQEVDQLTQSQETKARKHSQHTSTVGYSKIHKSITT